MKKRLLIIGGYGNFGQFISRTLAIEPDIILIIAGRSAEKAQALAAEIQTEWAALDIHRNLDQSLQEIKPDIVIHTSGPFQAQGYEVAEACIRHRCHYIDLADGRDFVMGIKDLNAKAQAAGVLVMSGASSVPCLTSAVIEEYKSMFACLESIDYGIATAQKTNRGLATTQAVLSYAGKPFTTLIKGTMQPVYGWQDMHFHKFKDLGWRLLGNCNIPDLSLFPDLYPGLKTIRFYAGLEIPLIHLGLWILTWLARLKLISSLEKAAPALLKLARLFDFFGSDRSAFYMRLSGQKESGQSFSLTFDLTAKDGFGPYIPCIPSILLAKRLARGQITQRGAAYPCLGFITLKDYLQALESYKISWSVSET